MEWLTVISLVLVGIILIIVEIIFIPGTTIVGIIGFCLALGGVIMSFNYFGNPTGYAVMGGTAVVSGLVLFWSLRTKAWQRLSLKSAIRSKVNEGSLDSLKEGEEGVAVSSLRPSGKADLGGSLYEVTTLGNFVDSGTRVKVIRISSHQIIVEPLT
jgi:membrane-bound ClpP family serine protease